MMTNAITLDDRQALIAAYQTMATQLRHRMHRPEMSPKQLERDYLQLLRTKAKLRELKGDA